MQSSQIVNIIIKTHGSPLFFVVLTFDRVLFTPPIMIFLEVPVIVEGLSNIEFKITGLLAPVGFFLVSEGAGSVKSKEAKRRSGLEGFTLGFDFDGVGFACVGLANIRLPLLLLGAGSAFFCGGPGVFCDLVGANVFDFGPGILVTFLEAGPGFAWTNSAVGACM